MPRRRQHFRTSAPPHLRTFLAGAFFALQSLAAARVDAEPPRLGEHVFNRHCAVCHGLDGSGSGAAAPLFTTRPRDFRSGIYKFRSTASGQLPTDEDITRTVRNGLPGSGMVPQGQLGDAEIAAVVRYVKSFSPRFEKAAPKPLALPGEVARAAAPPERGRQVYIDNGCPECHGESTRGDGPSAAKLSLPPADLTARPFKGGATAADIVRTIVTGLDGTPMPSYHLVIDGADLWALAHWVESLGGTPAMKRDERLGWGVEEREPPAGRYAR